MNEYGLASYCQYLSFTIEKIFIDLKISKLLKFRVQTSMSARDLHVHQMQNARTQKAVTVASAKWACRKLMVSAKVKKIKKF